MNTVSRPTTVSRDALLTGTAGIQLVELKEKPGTQVRTLYQHAHAGSRVSNGYCDEVYSLAGMSVRPGIPLLQQHDHTKIVGMTEKSELQLTGPQQGLHLYGKPYDTQAFKDVAHLADQGFPWQASIGVRKLELAWVDAGESLEVNGRLEQGPFLHVAKSEVYESSYCPVGADRNTRGAVLSSQQIEIPKSGNAGKDATMSVTKVGTPPAPSAETGRKTEDELRLELKTKEKARQTALKAEFADDPTFCLQAIEEDLSLEQAQAKYSKVLRERLKNQGTQAGGAPDIAARGGTGGTTLSACDEWDATVNASLALLPATSPNRRWAAVEAVAKTNPNLHQRMLEEYNKRVAPRTRRGS